MSGKLEGKIILVTGAASGLGKASALALAARGAFVVLTDINDEAGQAVVEEIHGAGGQAEFEALNITDEARIKEVLGALRERHGRLDGAINNAGVTHSIKRLADLEQDDFDQVIGVNLKGLWLCMKHELLIMVEQQRGQIVNVASVAGIRGAPMMALYAASKHGVVGLTRTAALEYARQGIRVNAVCPAVIDTPMAARGFADAPRFLETTIALNPMRRMGKAHEVAETIAWLCEDSSSFINGETIAIDGGLTA